METAGKIMLGLEAPGRLSNVLCPPFAKADYTFPDLIGDVRHHQAHMLSNDLSGGLGRRRCVVQYALGDFGL